MRLNPTFRTALLGGALRSASPVFGVTADGLSGIALPNATIGSAQVVAAGAFTPPPGWRGGGSTGTAAPAKKKGAAD
jgi:hypothetical protein